MFVAEQKLNMTDVSCSTPHAVTQSICFAVSRIRERIEGW
jgi:hypothetical protein